MVKGLSDNYLPVIFPFPRAIRNEMVPVRIEKMEELAVFGSPATSWSV
jgi:hypothetical protein